MSGEPTGCTNCGAKTGCTSRKGAMFEVLDRALARLYPTRTWGEPDDEARLDAGVSEAEAAALADDLAAALRACTVHVPGGPDEYCDYIYVLCVGREPCVIQLRDAGVPPPQELTAPGGAPVREQYLRVCLSHLARVAAVQQVGVDLDVVEGDLVVTERPRAGVYDALFLPRMRKLVALLPERGIEHLDFGEIAAPPAGFASGVYPQLFGGEPDTANYLFYPQPAGTQVTCLLEPIVATGRSAWPRPRTA